MGIFAVFDQHLDVYLRNDKFTRYTHNLGAPMERRPLVTGKLSFIHATSRPYIDFLLAFELAESKLSTSPNSRGVATVGVYRYTLPKSVPEIFCALIAADVVRLLVYRTVVSCSKNYTHPK